MNQNIYDNTIIELRAKIEYKFETVKECARVAELDYKNLLKALNGRQEMSVGTFIKLCLSLDLINSQSFPEHDYNGTLSLKAYLSIPYQHIQQAVLTINLS